LFASLNDDGRMAVVIDTGAASRGSGNTGANKERDIRKQFVEKDLVEAVILLPENLFYNTTAPAVILVVNKDKPKKGEIMLINASGLFKKGTPKNYLPENAVKQISDVFSGWKQEEGLSRVIKNEEAAKNDYNLSPSRYVAQNNGEDILPLEDAVVQYREAEEERAEADKKLKEVLKLLGLE